jgi:hypothetical protein
MSARKRAGFGRLLERLAKVVLLLVGVWAVLWVGMEAAARWQGMTPENRFALYEVRTSIRPGMSAEEVKGLLPIIKRKGLEYRWGDSGLSVWAHVGVLRAYFLQIDLRDGRVTHVSIRDSEGGGPVEDAPPDF